MKNRNNSIKLMAAAMLIVGAVACDKKPAAEPVQTTTVASETVAPSPESAPAQTTETTATVASSTDTTGTSATTATTATTATQEKK